MYLRIDRWKSNFSSVAVVGLVPFNVFFHCCSYALKQLWMFNYVKLHKNRDASSVELDAYVYRFEANNA